MKILITIFLSTVCLFYQNESKNTAKTTKVNSKNECTNPDLKCELDIEPKTWTKKQEVQIYFSLENISSSDLNIAKAIESDKLIWFRLKIEDEHGNIILSGLENESITTDDLPGLIFGKLKSNEKINITNRLILDSGFRFNIYNLKPGKYSISAVYRFEPDSEPYGAAFYKHETMMNKLWTGIIISKQVEIEILKE